VTGSQLPRPLPGRLAVAGAADSRRGLLGGLAVAGPLLFTAAWLIAWPMQEEYSPRHEDVSALAAVDAQRSWIMVLGFLMLGLGTVALALALLNAFRGRRSARVGAALLAFAGLGVVVAGLARNDCSSELAACRALPAGELSWHHHVHDLVSRLVFVSLVVAQLVLARVFGGDEFWRDLRSYSVVSGTATLVLLVVYGTRVFGDWNGLVQRVFLAVPFAWVVVVGVRVRRLPAGTRPESVS
jgi:hypothetical membrane protein